LSTKLVKLIERHQKELVKGMYGPRYSRAHRYRSGGFYTKSLVTFLGEIRFNAKKINRRSDGKISSPILDALDAR